MDTELIFLAIAWLAYAVLHSIVASLALKHFVANRWPQLMPWYRLGFNAVALLALVPVGLAWYWAAGDELWRWVGWQAWFANGLALVTILAFIHSTKFYDTKEFLGLRQLRENETRVEDQERLQISPYHRYVRHPWYFFGIVIIWTRNMDTAWLLSCLMITAYFMLGSRLEERKLLAYYGSAYAEYKRLVAGVFPLPWKILSVTKAKALEERGNTS